MVGNVRHDHQERPEKKLLQGEGFRVQGSGFSVQDSGFRVQGPAINIERCRGKRS